jgi:hypothetical protein
LNAIEEGVCKLESVLGFMNQKCGSENIPDLTYPSTLPSSANDLTLVRANQDERFGSETFAHQSNL